MEPPKKSKYSREAEKNQEIGDEFLNPDQDMEEAATKIQRFYRDKNQKKKEKETTAGKKKAAKAEEETGEKKQTKKV